MSTDSRSRRNSIFFILFVLLIITVFGVYYLLVEKPVTHEATQPTQQPSSQPSSKPNAQITVSGGIGVTNCEHAGPGCNAVTLIDSDNKQWDLILSDNQNQNIRNFKRVKVHGKIIHNANSDSIEVSSYEQL